MDPHIYSPKSQIGPIICIYNPIDGMGQGFFCVLRHKIDIDCAISYSIPLESRPERES